jgi:pimeloyl-ACP methyl ester carboxylesterase
MTRRAFPTPAGEVWLWDELNGLPSDRPLVLWIEGAFAIPRSNAVKLPQLLPEAAVVVGHLPGNHCPPASSPTLKAFAAAYDAAIGEIGRPTVVVGASVGALVALGLRRPEVRGLALLEPPLQTGKLWALIPSLRQRLQDAPDDAYQAGFIDSVFGVTARGVETRDYRPLVERIAVPAWAVFGGEPLMPPRPLPKLPSLVDEPERALLAARPGVSTCVAPGVGHNIAGYALAQVRDVVRDLLARTPADRTA